MGACCSKEANFGEGGAVAEDSLEERDYDGVEEDDHFTIGDFGARMRMQGASKYISMYSQQGKKGVNQDSMTVWEVNSLHFPFISKYISMFSHVFLCFSVFFSRTLTLIVDMLAIGFWVFKENWICVYFLFV